MAYIIADNSKLDGRFVPIPTALSELSTCYFGIIVSILPGRIAAYKGEDPTKIVWLIQD